MFLIFVMRLNELMELADIATGDENYDLEEQMHKEIEALRDSFRVEFGKAYGVSFDQFEETLNLSYDHVC
jgi:hypothetical protein